VDDSGLSAKGNDSVQYPWKKAIVERSFLSEKQEIFLMQMNIDLQRNETQKIPREMA
jgi:hypothetical protein